MASPKRPNPKSLNQKLQSVEGFAGAGIRWSQVSQLHPQVRIKSIIACADTPAPLAQIDAAIAAGQPAPAPVSTTGPTARVKADVNLGLNILRSEDTSTKENIVDAVHAGDLLTIMEPNGWTKIGAINQWVRVRTKNGKEGLAAAWYLEKVPGEEYPPTTGSTSSASEADSSSPANTGLIVTVKAKVGKAGAKVYETASKKSKVVSTEPVKAKLTVIEDAVKAEPKVGKAGKWLYVQTAGGAQGFIEAEFVKTL